MVCVTFKFVCFDGIEGKKLTDEVEREKRERKKKKKKKKRKKRKEKKELCRMKLECSGVGGKKEKGTCVLVWRGKKEGKKRKRKEKGTCVEKKKRGRKKKGRKYG